jgi:hypothetical protein
VSGVQAEERVDTLEPFVRVLLRIPVGGSGYVPVVGESVAPDGAAALWLSCVRVGG